jgi:hypothetical protein
LEVYLTFDGEPKDSGHVNDCEMDLLFGTETSPSVLYEKVCGSLGREDETHIRPIDFDLEDVLAESTRSRNIARISGFHADAHDRVGLIEQVSNISTIKRSL